MKGRLPLFVVREAVIAARSPWSSTERLIALLIAGFMDKKGHGWPSVGLLSEQSRYGRRTVQRALARLCGPGGLFIKRQGGSTRGGRRRASEYHLATRASMAPVPAPQRRRLDLATGATDDTRPAPQTTRTGATVAHQESKKSPKEETREDPRHGGAGLSLREALRSPVGYDERIDRRRTLAEQNPRRKGETVEAYRARIDRFMAVEKAGDFELPASLTARRRSRGAA